MAMFDMCYKIISAMDKNEYSYGIFIDLFKAFDTLDHMSLLQKLEHYGICGIALEWFKSYLSCRKQHVSFDGICFLLIDITCVVSPGSILGPLLFILYISDVVNIIDYT